MNYSDKIKELRKGKGISQADMADLIGISQAAYGKIESGFTKSISIEIGKGIARVLNVSFNELFEIEDSNSEDLKKQHEVWRKEMQVIINSLKEKKKQLEEKDRMNQLLQQQLAEYKQNEYAELIVDSFETIFPLIDFPGEKKVLNEKEAFILKEEKESLRIIIKKCLDEKVFSKEELIQFFIIFENDFFQRFVNEVGNKDEFYENLTNYLNHFYEINKFETERHLSKYIKKEIKGSAFIEELKEKYNIE